MKSVHLIFIFLLLTFSIIGQQSGLVIEHGSPQLHIKGELEAIRIDGKHRWINFVDQDQRLGFLRHEGEKMYLSNLQNGELYFRTNGTNQLTILPEGDVDINHSIILGNNQVNPKDGMIRWNENANNAYGDFEGYMNGHWQSLTICSITVCDRQKHGERIDFLESKIRLLEEKLNSK